VLLEAFGFLLVGGAPLLHSPCWRQRVFFRPWGLMSSKLRPSGSKSPTELRRWLRLLSLAVVLLLACAPEQKQVASPASAALGMGAHLSPLGRGPFRVAFSGPKGEASHLAQIQIVFSEPIRELSLAGDEATPPLTITPEIEGRWQWIGTRALSFVPKSGQLREATRYVVAVSKSLKALSGHPLAADFRWDFSTERPQLLSSEPHREAEGQLPTTALKLRFNQPISPETLKVESGLFALKNGKLTPLAFNVVQPKPAFTKLLEIRPSAPWPLDSRIELRITDKLGGLSGPLLSGTSSTLGFSTYGPLRAKITCSRPSPSAACEAGGAPGVELSNPVKFRELRHAVRITPPVKLSWDSWQGDDEPTSWLGLSGPFLAGRTYTISLDANLRDAYGQMLANATKTALTFGDYLPTLSLGVEGETFEPDHSPKIPIASVNLKRFKVTTAALTPINVSELAKLPELTAKALYLGRLKAANSSSFQPVSPKNQPAQTFIDVSAILKDRGRGPLAILTEYVRPDGQPERELRVLQVTDLAISAKLSEDKALVWVSRLSTGEPVANASVEIFNGKKSSKRYTTDASGLAELARGEVRASYESEASRLIVVRTSDDVAFRHSEDFIAPWRLDVPTDFGAKNAYYGVLFTERGLYRPGDEVKLKGIVRREAKTGNEVAAGLHFEVEAESSDGRTVLRHAVTTSAYGSFDLSFRLPLSASLGSFSVRTRGLTPGGLYETFSVAEYQPAAFKVSAESSKPSYQHGERAKFTVRGDYLYGAAMAGADLTYRVTRNPTSYSVPKSAGLVTDASVYDADLDRKSPGFATLKDGKGKLNAQGQFAFPIDLALPGQTGPEAVSVDAELSDVSRQSLSASTTSIVHPARFYLGLKEPTNHFVDAPATLAPEFTALDPTGRHVAGRNVSLQLVRRRWTLVREQQGDSFNSTTHAVDEVVSTCNGVTGEKLASCSLKVPDAGYFIVLARAKDAAGQEARAAYSLYGIGAGQAWWSDSNDHKLALTFEKQQYSVGETARLLIRSPFPQADAIVTVERAGVYEKRRIRVTGPTPTISIPVTDAIRPNAFVAVELLRPRTAPPKGPGKPDIGAPTFRLGYAELRVDAEARRLRVDLTPNARDYRPGSEVSVEVSVKTAKGQPHPAEVTLYAVDEGVLSLTNYHAPDPIKIFTAPRPLQVATLESREGLAKLKLDALGEILGLQKGAEGGGGGEGASSLRRDFRQSVYFNPSLMVGPSGVARASFKLPDSLTSFRIMAVAAALDDRYGFAETSITSSKPLMARPALPRFFRAGDAVSAGIVLSAKNFGPSEIAVRAESSGLALLEEPLKRVQLARDESKEVRFKFRADKVGKATLSFKVRSDKENDSVEVVRNVQSPASLEASALYGETRARTQERLGDLSQVRRDVGTLTLTASSTALVGLDAGVSQLLDYPYACTEQLSSRILPLLPLSDLAHELGFALPPDAGAIIERTVAEIVSRQRGDGGFGLWPESEQSSPWVTPYALWVLHEAKQHKVAFPRDVLERGVEFLRQYLARTEEERIGLATQTLIVDVLAMLGKPDSGYTTRLAQKAELPSFAKALLLHAMAISKEPEAAQRPLLQSLENSLQITDNRAFSSENLGDAYAPLMDSPARTTALVLRALLAARPNHPLGAPLARGLLRVRQGGTWQTTQETAFALLALNDYRKAQENETPRGKVRITLGPRTLLSEQFDGRSAVPFVSTLPLLGLTGRDLVFEKEGTGTLFYEARLSYARQKLPIIGLDRGFFVQKTLRVVEPAALATVLTTLPTQSQTIFQGGDLVVTDLILVTDKAREYVVLDDRLAAGMEAIDTSLATTAAWLLVPSSGFKAGGADSNEGDSNDYDERAQGPVLESVAFRQELRDDRALFFVDHLPPGIHHFRYLARATSLGNFVIPPTKAEEMYNPENFGRTGATHIEVR